MRCRYKLIFFHHENKKIHYTFADQIEYIYRIDAFKLYIYWI